MAAVADAVDLTLVRACASHDDLSLAPLDARLTIPPPPWEQGSALQSAYRAPRIE